MPASDQSFKQRAQTHSLGLYWHPVSLADKYSLDLFVCMVYVIIKQKSLPCLDTLRCFDVCDFHSERQKVYVEITGDQAVKNIRPLIQGKLCMYGVICRDSPTHFPVFEDFMLSCYNHSLQFCNINLFYWLCGSQEKIIHPIRCATVDLHKIWNTEPHTHHGKFILKVRLNSDAIAAVLGN